MEYLVFVFISAMVLVVILALAGIRQVSQSTIKIVERLGKFNRILQPGINFVIPFIDQIRMIPERVTYKDYQGNTYMRATMKSFIDMRERVYDYPSQSVITKDNVGIRINAILYFQVMDPYKAVYAVEDLQLAIEKLTQTTLRNVIGGLELDETLSSRELINTKLRLILDEASDKWGVKVNRVELQDIMPPKDIQDAMEKQMRAERERREKILRAEGEKESLRLTAEGEREKMVAEADGHRQESILQATGEADAKLQIASAEAKSIQMICEALGTDTAKASQYLLGLKYIEAFKSLASNAHDKVVFMPFESSSILGSLGALKELFNKTDSKTTSS